MRIRQCIEVSGLSFLGHFTYYMDTLFVKIENLNNKNLTSWRNIWTEPFHVERNFDKNNVKK